MAFTTLTKEISLPETENTNYKFPFILVTSLFFFWGFVHNLSPVLIPHLKNAFQLSTLEASLVDFSLFIAYFLFAVPAGLVMQKGGYKKGIITGLFLFAAGCFLIVPAANTMAYAVFLVALFIIASGLTFLETAANPYATILGTPATATRRLNFAQSFNGLAAFLAPLIGAEYILTSEPLSPDTIEAMAPAAREAYLLAETASVKMPYIVIGIAILLVAILFIRTPMPDSKEKSGNDSKILSAFRFSQVRWGVVAQFFYVGAQVCIFSMLILLASSTMEIAEKEAGKYASAAGLAFMLGRFVGTFLMRYIAPQKLLAIYAVICCGLTLLIIYGTGVLPVYAAIGVAFFMSIMFPTIFSLGVNNIGKYTKSGSSLIVMAIVGGAFIPPVLARIADVTHNIQWGYFVVLLCFIVILLFALTGHKDDIKR